MNFFCINRTSSLSLTLEGDGTFSEIAWVRDSESEVKLIFLFSYLFICSLSIFRYPCRKDIQGHNDLVLSHDVLWGRGLHVFSFQTKRSSWGDVK